MRSKGKTTRFAVALLALSSLLLLAAAGASAAPSAGSGWAPRASFTGGAQSETPRNPIAVDSHGNIFGSDQQSGLVTIFSPDPFAGGVPLSEFFPTGLSSARDLAVDPGDDTLYATATLLFEAPIIRRYTSDGAATPTYTVDPGFEVPEAAGTAVDPTTHDLLVADPGAEGVHRYSSAGALLGTIATPGTGPAYVVTAPDGSLYVASSSGPNILHLAGDGTVLGTIAAVGTSLGGLTWDSAHGQIVAAVGERLKAYSPAGQLRSESPAPPGGIAFDPTSGLLYQASGEYFSGTNYVYEPAAYPGTEVPVVSNIADHSVHLKAEVEPGEANPGHPEDGAPAESKAHFEYSADGGKNWKPLPDHDLSAPGVAVIEDDLTGLLANFDYLVRGVASNSKLTNNLNVASFATPKVAPEVATTAATDVSEDSAVLNGTISPFGLQATYHFEYGTTTSYGSRIPVSIEGAADGTYDTRIFSRTIEGLAPGATYHFRIVAQNSVGTSFGEDKTFTVTALGGVVKRAYEQVTPIDKQGRPLNVVLGFQARADGAAFAYVNFAAPNGSPFYSFAISHRESSDWHPGVDLSVPLNVPSAPGIVLGTTMAISSDFSKQLVATNRKLTPEASEGAINVYIQDIATGTYAFVGSAADSPEWQLGLGALIGLPPGADKFFGGASDFSWVLFKSIQPLIPGTAEGALYRWSEEGGLEVVSVVPGGGSEQAYQGNDKSQVLRWASSDGSRIYFKTDTGIYLREGDDPAKAISVSHIDGDPATPVSGWFFGASKDGRYAFFESVDTALTDDAVGKSGNVYRYDAATDSLEFIDAAAWTSDAFYVPIGVSDDGETAYFRTGAEVLVWHDGDVSQAAPSNLIGTGFSTIPMSPNGRYLGYEESGNVYLYDAEADIRTCASCLADGSKGEAFLPFIERVQNHFPRALTNSGQLFFTAAGRLVAADANGRRDVYMFQDGHPTLITPGNGPYDAVFADVSEDGSNVFFSTNQKLVGQDNDDSPDIYDARIGGGLASQNPPPPKECLRDDCKATPNTGPELPFGGSEAVRGSENVKAPRKRCGKGSHARKVKGKPRCVKNAKGRKKQEKANANRRQGR